jgi:hypothetical protein
VIVAALYGRDENIKGAKRIQSGGKRRLSNDVKVRPSLAATFNRITK